MPLPLGFGISSVNAGVAARRVIVPYGCHGSRRAGSPPWPPVPRCGMFPRSSRRGGACPSRRVSEFFRSTLGWRRAGSSRPTDVMVHEGRAALRGRPSPVVGRFPVHPVGFWNSLVRRAPTRTLCHGWSEPGAAAKWCKLEFCTASGPGGPGGMRPGTVFCAPEILRKGIGVSPVTGGSVGERTGAGGNLFPTAM